MSKANKNKDNGPTQFQWVTDNKPCEAQILPPAPGFLVQVEGDLGGKPLVIRGGITTANVGLEVIRSAPALVQIPGVRVVQPDTEAEGVTITIQGVL